MAGNLSRIMRFERSAADGTATSLATPSTANPPESCSHATSARTAINPKRMSQLIRNDRRRKVRDSILVGISDVLVEIEGNDTAANDSSTDGICTNATGSGDTISGTTDTA